MDKYMVWYNSRCGTCGRVLKRLEAAGVEYETRAYLEDQPTRAEIENVIRLIGCIPGDILRRKGDVYESSGLDENSSDEEILAAMSNHSILINRPIVIKNDEKALLCRPDDLVEDLLK